MKLKITVISSIIICAIGLSFFNACTKTERKLSFATTDSCDCCKSYGGITKRVVNGDTLTFYSAFTPNNIHFCDSNVYVNGILSFKDCKPTKDSVYNDTLNMRFQIKGIENFPQNDLVFFIPGDSTKLDHFINFNNSASRSFTGIKIDTTIYGHERQRQLAQGKYKYILKLYKSNDRNHLQANLVDSIVGYFCLIRNLNINSKGCAGMSSDPLIQK